MRARSRHRQQQVKERSLGVIIVGLLVTITMLGGGIFAYYFLPNPDLLFPNSRQRGAITLASFDLAGGELEIPANYVARVKRRTLGGIEQIDLQVPWPYMPNRTDYLRLEEVRSLDDWLLMSLELRPDEGSTQQDRFRNIYPYFFAGGAKAGPAGLRHYAFKPTSPYADLQLFVAPGEYSPVLIHCDLKVSILGSNLCERRLPIDDRVELRYRFARKHLDEWKQIDETARSIVTQSFRRRAFSS